MTLTPICFSDGISNSVDIFALTDTWKEGEKRRKGEKNGRREWEREQMKGERESELEMIYMYVHSALLN